MTDNDPLQMQIQMITQMMGAAGPDGVVDPDAQARMVLEQLGYGEEEMGQLLGGEQEDTITEEVLGDIVPAEFGYGDIVTAISSLASLSEEHPAPADPERMRRFEVLLTGIISVLNDHKLDGLDVEPRDQDSRDLVLSILSDYWGVEDRDDLIGVLRYLIVEGHTKDYMNALEVISASGTAEDLHTEDMDDEDRAVSDARFAFTEAYAGQFGPAMLRGWDLGRAANVTRWGYFVGFIDEEEAWGRAVSGPESESTSSSANSASPGMLSIVPQRSDGRKAPLTPPKERNVPISLLFSDGSSGTMTQPAKMTPKYAITHSAELWPDTAILSPGRKPLEMRKYATSLIFLSPSLYVSFTSGSNAWNARLSG